MDRRALLFALGAGLALPADAASPRAGGGRIDVHHHYLPPEFHAFNRRFLKQSPAPSVWDKAEGLADMDRSGTALAVLSGFTSHVGGTIEDRRALARATNDFGAALMKERPGRHALFATLPLPDMDGCLREMEYGLDTLGAVGVTVYADSGDRWLGDPSFTPLHEALNRRKAVVFVHPHSPDCCVNLVKGVPDSLIEFAATTTRTIASLIFNGVTVRYPDIRFIFAHGGGVMPFLIERLLGGAQAEIVPGVITRGQPIIPLKQPPGTALRELRRMYYDTAQIANPVALRALKDVIPSSQILYGTDVWYRSAQETSRGILQSGVFSARELEGIWRGNAMRLMPSLARQIRAA
jgi:6-methylsalicylate decarboxylase